MAKQNIVVIQVSGGVVQSIHATPGYQVHVVLIDHDNYEDGDHLPGASDREAERQTAGLETVEPETFPD